MYMFVGIFRSKRITYRPSWYQKRALHANLGEHSEISDAGITFLHQIAFVEGTEAVLLDIRIVA